ncbi:MAG: ABC transporter ATP-binding protein, partial [Clostridia bacterium]|nr:ABC transporter ATP-binding protein [Clostridia bacterium]
MLELDKITKVYKMGNNKVDALKGVSISFREREFVSILGPSGCGKTTLLNIIGGLDKYTTGDLKINGISTTKYKDKNWDTYRNHRVGFIFQSYNLIPHQTVLENVEIALTLSGVSRKERKQRATEALIQVGLGDKLNNKPNQLSGGQMQRVAIARALVNNPEIILADEPTGALDTESSTQIMEILKSISKDRLIIMVTHNPELAEKYSTRIVNLLDGELTNDSNPYTEKEIVDNESAVIDKSREKGKKHRMSFLTALFLSFKNLLTKKTRTILVSFAGSIGIIGIAVVLALSSGFSSYINKLQENTLSTYPITISSSSIDMSSILGSFLTTDDKKVNHDKESVYVNDRISKILDMVGGSAKANNVKKFYDYLKEHYGQIENQVNAVQYTYDIGAEIYNENDDLIQPNGRTLYNMIVKYSLFKFEDMTKLTVEFTETGCTISTNENTPTVEPPQEETEAHAAYDSLWRNAAGYLGQTKTERLKTDGTISLSNSEIETIITGVIGM